MAKTKVADVSVSVSTEMKQRIAEAVDTITNPHGKAGENMHERELAGSIFFNRLRNSGTPEEKRLAVDSLVEMMEKSIAEKRGVNTYLLRRASDAILLFGDPRAAETLEKIGNGLRSANVNWEYDRIAEIAAVLKDAGEKSPHEVVKGQTPVSEALGSTVVSAKVNFIYPESSSKFDGEKMAEARELVASLRHGDAELRRIAGSALDDAVKRAVEDALSPDAGVRAVAYCYFNNVRESGTQEEKDAALAFLTSHVEVNTASQPALADAERVGRAAEMLKFLFEGRAISALYRACETLAESESERIREIGRGIEETVFILKTAMGTKSIISAGEAEFKKKMLG